MIRDLANVPHFWQYDAAVERAGPTACYRACRLMAQRVGGKVPEGTERRIQVALSEAPDGSPADIDRRALELAWHYVVQQIDAGHPVVMGTSYKPGSLNRDHITDHFCLVVGYDDAQGARAPGWESVPAVKRLNVHDPGLHHPAAHAHCASFFAVAGGTFGRVYSRQHLTCVVLNDN